MKGCDLPKMGQLMKVWHQLAAAAAQWINYELFKECAKLYYINAYYCCVSDKITGSLLWGGYINRIIQSYSSNQTIFYGLSSMNLQYLLLLFCFVLATLTGSSSGSPYNGTLIIIPILIIVMNRLSVYFGCCNYKVVGYLCRLCVRFVIVCGLDDRCSHCCFIKWSLAFKLFHCKLFSSPRGIQ